MKRLFLLLAIVFVFSTLNAQETYRFRSDHPQGFSIESSTATGISLHYGIAELGIADIDNGEAKGKELILKGSFGSFAEGLPNLPAENRYIAVPHGATISVEVKENSSQTIYDIDLLPAAPEQGNTQIGLPKLHKDMSVFGKDANYPSEAVAIVQTTQIRGLDVVLLSVTPFRYNPVRQTLEVIYDMDIEVRFEGGDGQFGDIRYRNPDWDNILHDLVINNDMPPETHYYEMLNEAVKNREVGCEYLIIAPDDNDILAWADTLRNYRTRQGILTKVVTTTECGGDRPEDIKGYIQNAYDNWAIPPATVMLFGGYMDTLYYFEDSYYPSQGFTGIRGFPLIFLNYNDTGDNYNYYSDNPYADMNADSIPDIALSRLPALTITDYKTQVEKLIAYESNPPTDAHYYDCPIITSGYEENKWFMITSQSVNGFYRNKLRKHPNNLYVVYDYGNPNPVIPDSIWSTGYNTDAVMAYFGPNGQNYIPRSIGELNDWIHMEDSQYLKDAFNSGSFLTFYRDHCSYDLWACPYFYSHDIPTLTNTDPTFLISIGCHTARYDFSYESWSGNFNTNPLIGAFCKDSVGAMGGIGAATVTHSHFNDILTWGLLDHIWPTFMPDMGTSTTPEFNRPVYDLVAGKLFLNQHAFLPDWWPQKVTTTQNVFHYLGESYLNLYTEVPQQMAIDAPAYHKNNQWEYNFIAEEGAVVCLSHHNEILATVQATGYPQCFILPQMAVNDQFVITATKRNCIRFEQTVKVIDASQPFIYVKNVDFDDLDGNGQLDYGEHANLNVTLFNVSNQASEGGQITLLCDSPYVEILQGTAQYSRINPDDSSTLENAFSIRIANTVPDQTALKFKVRVDDLANSHEDPIEAVVCAPNLYISPDFFITQADDEPSTHIVTNGNTSLTFNIINLGHSQTPTIGMTLDIKAPFVSIDTVSFLCEPLQPYESAQATFTITTDGSVIDPAWLQARLHVQFGDYEIVKDTIVQYGGIFENFEIDALNPNFGWYIDPEYPWLFDLTDAYECMRCISSYASTTNPAYIGAYLIGPYVNHKCKVSFRYKTSIGENLLYFNTADNLISLFSEEWQYVEALYNGSDLTFNWSYLPTNENSPQAKIDDICFPPLHRVIAYAGKDKTWCRNTPVELNDAYAYDYNSLRWSTIGDGHFENNDDVNTVYHPGIIELALGQAYLTLKVEGDETITESIRVRFVNEIQLNEIIGESLVNKYEEPVSHYYVENQDNINYVWQLEPAYAGSIYAHGNNVDIVWNLQETDLEAVLSLTANNGCDTEPVIKHITLIDYEAIESQSISFSLYPNPTDGKVNLVISETLQGKALVEVYNLLGERMMAKNIGSLQGGSTITLDLSHFVSGLYIIKLNAENGSCSKKVSVW